MRLSINILSLLPNTHSRFNDTCTGGCRSAAATLPSHLQILFPMIYFNLHGFFGMTSYSTDFNFRILRTAKPSISSLTSFFVTAFPK